MLQLQVKKLPPFFMWVCLSCFNFRRRTLTYSHKEFLGWDPNWRILRALKFVMCFFSLHWSAPGQMCIEHTHTLAPKSLCDPHPNFCLPNPWTCIISFLRFSAEICASQKLKRQGKGENKLISKNQRKQTENLALFVPCSLSVFIPLDFGFLFCSGCCFSIWC